MSLERPAATDPRVRPLNFDVLPSRTFRLFLTMEASLAGHEERAADFAAEFQVGGYLAQTLVQHVAVHSLRLERMAAGERAWKAKWLDEVGAPNGPRRRSSADYWYTQLATSPTAARRLRETSEGIARLLVAWDALRRDVTDDDFPRWTADHLTLAEALIGRLPGAGAMTDFRRYTEVYDQHPSPLVLAAELAGRTPAQRQEYARSRLAEFIAAEMARLTAERAPLAAGLAGRERAEAEELARYLGSPDGRRIAREIKLEERQFAMSLRLVSQAERLTEDQAAAAVKPRKPRRAESMTKLIARLISEQHQRVNLLS